MFACHDHPAPEKHDHVVLHMENGARITFNDPRRFGAMDLMDTATAEQHPLLATLGPEPLGNSFHEAHLIAALQRPQHADQIGASGSANRRRSGQYLCLRGTFSRPDFTPHARPGAFPPPRVAALVPIIRDVLAEAIEAGGSSLRDFRQADGELGYFQHSFDVYGREGDPCRTRRIAPRHIARIVQSGRSSFYCPPCQR